MPEPVRKRIVRKMVPDGDTPGRMRVEERVFEGDEVEAIDHEEDEGHDWKSGRWEIRLRLPADASEMKGKLDPLEVLAGMADGLRDLEGKVGEIVRFARAEGHTWTKIGEALGVSKQAAWERFSGED